MKTIIRWIGIILSCISSVVVTFAVFFLSILPYLLVLAILALVVVGLWKVVM